MGDLESHDIVYHGIRAYPSSTSTRAVSMAFTPLKTKRSPSLTIAGGEVECTSADAIDFLLQPKENDGPLNGVFVEDGKPKKMGKEEETKVCIPYHEYTQNWIGADGS